MAYDPKKAALYNQLRQRGLSEDEAWSQSGISESDTFNYVIGLNGELGANISRGSKVAGVDYERPSPAEQAESDRWFQSLESGDDDEPPSRTSGVFARTTYPQAPSGLPAQQPTVKTIESTTTAQETVTGGSVTTTRVAPTEFVDNDRSRALQAEADAVQAQKEARAAELRAQGLPGGSVLRDPEYRRLSQEQYRLAGQAGAAKDIREVGSVSVTTEPGLSTTNFGRTQDSQYLTAETAGLDPQVNLQDANRFSTSGELPRNFVAGDVTDTGGVPTQSLTNIEDPGFVPQSFPEPIQPGFSPYGEEDDPFDPDFATEPEDVEFADDYFASGDFASLEAAQAREAEAFGRDLPDDGISPYGEADDEFDPDLVTEPGAVTGDPQVDPQGPAFDDDGNLNPGFTLDGDGEPIFIGDDFVDPSLTASAEASRAAARQQATLDNARRQATIQSQRKQGNDTDWRVRLSLAPQANYLYMAPDVGGQPGSGILAPLRRTNGVIFPYTPRITTAYVARYNNYDLTHSNYRGYFYQGSHVEDVNIEATFTAQDTAEAEYMLAVIHFFRSITKMFYGQDAQRGTPPPLVYLRGLGEFQYNLHPCVVSQFNYNLPSDVDYIRARSKNTVPPGLLQRRQRESVPTDIFSNAEKRLSDAGLAKGAQPAPPPVPSLGLVDASYVPTKLDLQITLKPMQSREQVSRQFSLKQYANGDLLKGGFW